MLAIDRALGSRAEFLNAWSVVERLLGHPPTAGTSIVASRLGPAGEFISVIAANLAVGFLVALLIRLASRIF